MLGLLTPTPTTWLEAARQDLPGLLADHAHCELKAAQNALALVSRYGSEAPNLIAPLCELAREETEHFGQVCASIQERNWTLTRPEPDAYVNALWQIAKPERGQVPVLMDKLLVASLIEARSCERFRLLSEGLPDPAFARLYRGLMASEARHHRLFARLSEELFGADRSRARLEQLAGREAAVADQLPLGATVHG